MAIDLNKDKNELKYYCSEDGKILGPYSLTELLKKIEADTLVYREGIEWTNAKDVDELRKFFKEHDDIIIENIIATEGTTINEGHIEPRKMFLAPFAFEGRIRRLEYGISWIIYYVAYVVILALVEETPIIGLAMIPIFWFLLAQGAKRCHDRGNSGWYQIIPFYQLWMIFAEGEKGVNDYGNPPKNH